MNRLLGRARDHVRRVLDDLAPLLAALLTRVAPYAHRRGAAEADAQILLEFTELAVGEGVHWVDDDRLDAAGGAVSQHMIHDRNNLGEALARAGARRYHVWAARSGRLDCADLVAEEAQVGPKLGGAPVLAPLEHLGGRGVQQVLADQVAHVGVGGVRGVKLHDRFGPQDLFVEGGVDGGADVVGANADEAADVLGVIGGEGVAEAEDVHGAVRRANVRAASIRLSSRMMDGTAGSRWNAA